MHPKNNYSEFRIKIAFLPGWDEKILFVCIDNEGYMNTGMQPFRHHSLRVLDLNHSGWAELTGEAAGRKVHAFNYAHA